MKALDDEIERIARHMMRAEHGDKPQSDNVLVYYLRYARLACDAMKAIQKTPTEERT